MITKIFFLIFFGGGGGGGGGGEGGGGSVLKLWDGELYFEIYIVYSVQDINENRFVLFCKSMLNFYLQSFICGGQKDEIFMHLFIKFSLLWID